MFECLECELDEIRLTAGVKLTLSVKRALCWQTLKTVPRIA